MFNDKVAYANVENSLEEILRRSKIVKDMFEHKQIGIVGGVYNIENGQVDFFKNLTQKTKADVKMSRSADGQSGDSESKEIVSGVFHI